MTDPTDKQLEWAARVLCVATGYDPDEKHYAPYSKDPRWTTYKDSAYRLLAKLERQGVKAVERNAKWFDLYSNAGIAARSAHQRLYDAAPICPDADSIERLGADFEKIWDDNKGTLYED